MSVVPIWMEAPSTGVVPPPPIDSLNQTLPFGELAWEDFERLALRLIRREADVADCAIYGTPGQSQEGIDILAVLRIPEADKWCYQCKRVTSFGPADIRDAVTHFLDGKFASDATTLVLCVSASLQKREQVEAIALQRELLRGRGIKLLTWDGSEGGMLAEKLKANPDLVDDFFGREWVKRFNGNSTADALGARLDGIDQAQLLYRLRALYIALFNQFDPGPKVPGGACASFGFRYVRPDILKTVRVEGHSPSPGQSDFARASDAQQHAASLADPQSTFDTRRPLLEWLRQRPRGTILGDPGYGKSAFLKFLTLAMLDANEVLEETIDTDQLTRVPVWLSFAAFSSAINRDFGTSVSSYFTDWLSRNSFADVKPLVERALRSSRLLLLIDGLDEVPDQGNARIALDRLVAFVEGTNSHVICTSRPRGFAALGVPATWNVAELAPLSDAQILELSQKSIALTNEAPTSPDALSQALERAAMEASRYLAAVRSNERTHQLARTPLLCLALVDLFRQSSRLPEDRVSVYRQIIDLLIARHPGQRARAADETSAHSQVLVKDADLKRMLGRLASSMQSSSSVTFTTAFCAEVFVGYLKDENEGLGRPQGEARQIADNLLQSLVARLGIIVERSSDEFAFAHLSLQEFLCAETLVLSTKDIQLSWISEHWSTPFSREVVLSWFGIQAALGRKEFASRAVQQIKEQSGTDRLASMRALELCVELACSDLGLPVRDAREIVHDAFEEIRTSPFSEYQKTLSRSIALGAIASSVRDECRECIRLILPGRSASFRTDLLEHLRTWSPSNDLRDALFQALLDENIRVRRASASTLASIPCKRLATAP